MVVLAEDLTQQKVVGVEVQLTELNVMQHHVTVLTGVDHHIAAHLVGCRRRGAMNDRL
jgi:hypothetical protein